MLKSCGVTGGADAKNFDENKRAQVKGKVHYVSVFVALTFKIKLLIYCDFVLVCVCRTLALAHTTCTLRFNQSNTRQKKNVWFGPRDFPALLCRLCVFYLKGLCHGL